jgi:hypothetical protein
MVSNSPIFIFEIYRMYMVGRCQNCKELHCMVSTSLLVGYKNSSVMQCVEPITDILFPYISSCNEAVHKGHTGAAVRLFII